MQHETVFGINIQNKSINLLKYLSKIGTEISCFVDHMLL